MLPAARIRHMLVTVQLETLDLGGVTLTITGPDGENTSTFIAKPKMPEGIPGDDGQPAGLPTTLGYTFDTTHAWGGRTDAGEWTLRIAAGTQAVELAGRSIQAPGDAVPEFRTFVYTDEYGFYAAIDADRRVLAGNGGMGHAINAAAVTTGSVIDLRPGAIGSIAQTDFPVAGAR